MKRDPNRREFLRNASLAGMALLAGCHNGKSKTSTSQVHIDANDNLVIDDPQLRANLWEIWKRQRGKPHEDCSPEGDNPTPDPNCVHKGIHVKFEHSVPAEPGRDPEDHKVNSLCSC